MGEKTYIIKELSVYNGILSVVVFGHLASTGESTRSNDGEKLTMAEIKEFIALSEKEGK